MEKFETGGFPTGKGLFIQTDGELYGSFGDKKLFPYQSLPIFGEVRKAVEKSLLKQNGGITAQYGKENRN